jgi:hypothetical protein
VRVVDAAKGVVVVEVEVRDDKEMVVRSCSVR